MGLDTTICDVSQYFTESTATLGAAGTFTGPWRDSQLWNWFGAVALSDQAGTLYVDEADANPPNYTNLVAKQASAATDAAAPTPPAAGQQARLAPNKIVLRQLRVRYINGATPQTRFALLSTASPLY